MKKTTNFKVGDSVVVKEGIKCPDMQSLSIAGWQGRIIEIDDEDGEILIDIKWDSITLKSLPKYYIEDSEENGLCWYRMILGVNEVKRTSPRDTEKDVQIAIDELTKLHTWDFLGEEGSRINEVLKDVDLYDDYACMEAWLKHLRKVLIFPFDAEIIDSESALLRVGNQVQVNNIAGFNDFYGIIVNITFDDKKYTSPLCDLEVLDEKSPNYQNVQDYVVWFANL